MNLRSIPPLDWMLGYQRPWLRLDVVAGLTAAAVIVPKAMAYATVAGLPVQTGLYTALVPLLVYALLGSSRVLSVSTTTTLAILLAAQLDPNATAADRASDTATLTAMVGFILLVAAVLRLGFVANFISEPVLTGFKAGIGLVIVVDQVPKMLGFHIDKGSFLHNVGEIVRHIPESAPLVVLIAVATIAGIGLLHRFAPRLPAPLVVIGAGIVAVEWLGLDARGVATVGAIPTGLPGWHWPELDLGRMESYWPAAMAIALMSFTESIAAARVFTVRGEPRPLANRELFATGAANLAGAWFGAMPAGGGTSQTAVNRHAGAHTQVAGLVTAASTVAILLLLAPVLERMPQATLAAVVVAYSVGLISVADFVAIRRIHTRESRWALVATAGVILLGTLKGVLLAVIVSLIALVHQSYRPSVYALGRKRGTDVFRKISSEYPEDETFPGLLLIRPEGRLYFANAQSVADVMAPIIEAENPRVVVFDLQAVFDIEYTALKRLVEAEVNLRERGIELWMTGANPGVLDAIRRSTLGPLLGRERLIFTLADAVDRYRRSQSSGTA
jgi:sulfate permease, SulP family